jgi:hypothetical protein
MTKIIITVPTMIDGAQVQPDMGVMEVRDDLADYLIATCVAMPASHLTTTPPKNAGQADTKGHEGDQKLSDEEVKPVRAKKDKGVDNE